MQAFFQWLAAIRSSCCSSWSAARCWLGKVTIKGYGLGMVASAIVVGAALSAWASTYGVKMSLDNFAKSLFYYLFMYGVGLRVGPSFINSLKGDGLKFTFLAVVLLGARPARRGAASPSCATCPPAPRAASSPAR